MILRGGELDGKRYLSEKGVQAMTSRQTSLLPESYGLGWSVQENSFGHGGAYSTNMTLEPESGLITVFLVQHAGFAGNGGASCEAFRNAAKERFA